jgi:hypothetical protein
MISTNGNSTEAHPMTPNFLSSWLDKERELAADRERQNIADEAIRQRLLAQGLVKIEADGSWWAPCDSCNGQKHCSECEGAGSCPGLAGVTDYLGHGKFAIEDDDDSACERCHGTGKCWECEGAGRTEL